ncbi:MAG: hypothetical protein WDA53_05740, partial [Bacillota bacterium]
GYKGERITIFTADGKKVDYPVDKDFTDVAGINTITLNQLVKYNLNSDGEIENIANVANANSIAQGQYRSNAVEIGSGNWYTVTDSTVIIADKNATEYVVGSWETLKKAIDAGIVTVDGVEIGRNNRLSAVYVNQVLSSGQQIGVIAGKGTDAKGNFYDVLVGGEKVRYNTSVSSAAKNDIVSFTLSGGKINSITSYVYTDVVAGNYPLVQGKVVASGNDFVTVNNQLGGTPTFGIDKDTVIVDITDGQTGPKVVSRVARDDYVRVLTGVKNGAIFESDSAVDKGIYKLIVIYKP